MKKIHLLNAAVMPAEITVEDFEFYSGTFYKNTEGIDGK